MMKDEVYVSCKEFPFSEDKIIALKNGLIIFITTFREYWIVTSKLSFQTEIIGKKITNQKEIIDPCLKLKVFSTLEHILLET